MPVIRAYGQTRIDRLLKRERCIGEVSVDLEVTPDGIVNTESVTFPRWDGPRLRVSRLVIDGAPIPDPRDVELDASYVLFDGDMATINRGRFRVTLT